MTLLRQIETEAAHGLTVGETTGATAAEVVASPAAGFVRVVRSLRYHNLDTVAATIRTSVFDGTTTYVEIDSATKATGEVHRVLTEGEVIHLPEGYSLTVVLDGAVTTDEPTWAASWTDVPVPA